MSLNLFVLFSGLMLGVTSGLALGVGLFTLADRSVRRRREARRQRSEQRRCLYLDDEELVCEEPPRVPLFRANGSEGS